MIPATSKLTLSLLSFLLLTSFTKSFVTNELSKSSKTRLHATTVGSSTNSRLLIDYKTSRGETLNPYAVLKVSQDATTKMIKQSYYKLSKTYHPDGRFYLFRDILPGNCETLQDVEYEWEKIKNAKDILTNNKTRVRYDRLMALLHPQDAILRSATKIVSNVVFDVVLPHCIAFGAFACKSIVDSVVNTSQKLEEEGMIQEMIPKQQVAFDNVVESISIMQDTAVNQFKVCLSYFHFVPKFNFFAQEFAVNLEIEWKKNVNSENALSKLFMKQLQL